MMRKALAVIMGTIILALGVSSSDFTTYEVIGTYEDCTGEYMIILDDNGDIQEWSFEGMTNREKNAEKVILYKGEIVAYID